MADPSRSFLCVCLVDAWNVFCRHGNEDYIFALLTGYYDPPAGVEPHEDQYFNAYMPGNWISMAPPLYNEIIEYSDGTWPSIEFFLNSWETIAEVIISFLFFAIQKIWIVLGRCLFITTRRGVLEKIIGVNFEAWILKWNVWKILEWFECWTKWKSGAKRELENSYLFSGTKTSRCAKNSVSEQNFLFTCGFLKQLL